MPIYGPGLLQAVLASALDLHVQQGRHLPRTAAEVGIACSYILSERYEPCL